MPYVIQFTVQSFGWVQKRVELTDGFPKMESSFPQKERRTNSRRWLTTAFLIYGTMVVGLLGYFIVFPDTKTHGTQGQGAPIQTAAKAVRYEAVIANWNRYRNKDARADAR
jgi:hypothetical protein